MAEVHAAGSIPDPSTAATDSLSTSTTASPLIRESTPVPRPMSPRKRRRSSKPSSIRDSRATPASASAKISLSPSPSPKALTGAAAIASNSPRRLDGSSAESVPVSANPAKETLEQLTAAKSQISKPNDAPDPTNVVNGPMADIPTSGRALSVGGDGNDRLQGSLQRLPSNAAIDRAPAPLAVDNGNTTASPSQTDDAFGDEEEGSRFNDRDEMRNNITSEENHRSNKAFTYPGPLGGPPHRSSSLPQAGYGRENSSLSAKRHKCPYCSTDFTRHHNLKSHLLTHSQEKPFSCERCDSRFRRLHDLKRHAKLHTGERPHVCPKCDRSFARGDALARHNKGQGGCAGRRESVGSFAGDERHDDNVRHSEGEGMSGIMYTNQASHEPEHMEEDIDPHAVKELPRIQRHHAPADSQQSHSEQQHLAEQAHFHSRQPSTYPPVAARPTATGQLYPPPAVTSPRSGTGTSNSQSSINHYPPPSTTTSTFPSVASSVFTQGVGMTESPKPLSPGALNSHQLGHPDSSLHRNRSSSGSHQPTQAHYRHPTIHNASPPMSLPAPYPSTAPHLPPLQGLAPPEPRYTLHSQSATSNQSHTSSSSALPAPPHGTNSPKYAAGTLSSANNSLSSQGTGRNGSIDRATAYGQTTDRLWAYVEGLSSKVTRLEEDINLLKQHGPPPPR